MMQVKKVIYTLLFILVTQSRSFAFNANQEAANGLSSVYGYVSAQENTLNQIEIIYPDLKDRVELVRLEFRATYGDVIESVKNIISTLFPGTFEQIIPKFAEQLKKYDSDNLTRPMAENFIVTVQNRSKGSIERDNIKKFLLATAYYKKPEQEYIRFKEEYDFTNDPKTKGLSLKLTTPQSWLASDSRFPNTLKTWRTDAGAGKGFASVEVQKFDGPKTSSDFVRSAVSKGEIPRGLLPKNAIASKIKYSEISTLPAVMSSFYLTVDRLGMKIHQRGSMLAVYNGDRVVVMNCSVGGQESEIDQLILLEQKYEKLCFLFFNSLIILNA